MRWIWVIFFSARCWCEFSRPFCPWRCFDVYCVHFSVWALLDHRFRLHISIIVYYMNRKYMEAKIMFHRLGSFIITLIVLLFAGALILLIGCGAIAIAITLIKIAIPIIAISLGIIILLGIAFILVYINI